MTDQQQIIIEQFGLSTVRNNPVFVSLANTVGSKLSSAGQLIQSVLPQQSIGTKVSSAGQFVQSLVPQPINGPDMAQFQSPTLGTPIFDTLIIKAGSYTDSSTTVTYSDFRIDTALITLTQAHNVIITPIQGRDGEIIEYSSKASFRINVKGGVFGTGLQRPTSDIAALNAVLQSNTTLTVSQCNFLTDFNISQFVILDKTFPQVEGGYNYQLFEFNAIQDIPVLLAQKQVQQ